MFGNYFYHQRIRKAVAFGAMFNDIYVLRKDASGGIISTQKVPLSYGPRSKFLDRIREVPDLEERRVAIKLPRMSFEIMNISYDPARQLPKNNVTARAPVAGSLLSRSKIEVGVPYMISFQLSVFAKLQDDALQVVEQVIPYFNPQYTLSIKPFDDLDTIKEDVPIILTGVTMNDDYEGEVASRRTIVYTMDFDMHVTFHGPITSSGIIRTAITDILDINAGLNDSDVPLERITVTPNPGNASPERLWIFNKYIRN